MKNLVTLIMASLFSTAMFANNAQLVVEKVDNGDAVPGNTYRVYVQLINDAQSIHAVFGDDQNSLSITTTGQFYQSDLGGNTSLDVNPQVIQLAPEVAYDTWLTIGSDNSAGNNLWNVGIDFNSFQAGSELSIEDGAWFLVPTDEKCTPDEGNLVLIAQITTTGEASGVINVQGWTAEHDAWQERGMTFHTSEAHTFGCTDAAATNYNADASYDNGSCEFSEVVVDNDTPDQADIESIKEEGNGWQVFPNPIWEGQFNIQFDDVIDGDNNVTIDIIDNSGKLVHSQEISDQNIIGGNRIIVNKDLAAGVYNVNVRHGNTSTTQQVVVQR